MDTILNMGDHGSAVKSLQEKLIQIGYSCGIRGADGDFGIATYNAVKKFQKNHGLSADGIAGSQTLTAIDKAIKSTESEGTEAKSVRVTANVLNVRSGPGMSYPAISFIRKGTIHSIVEEVDGWGRIASPAGWISSEYYEDV